MIKPLLRSLFLLAAALPLTCRAAEPATTAPATTAPATTAPASPAQATPARAPATAAPNNGAANGNKAATPTPAPEASLVDMVKALSQFLTEEEVQMVYDYLWDSSIAALKGSNEEITLPPELAFKLAILQKRIQKEGGRYLEGLALKMEKDLARWRESLNTPPPPPPYLLPSERAQQTQPKP